jgi:hypothetical protein
MAAMEASHARALPLTLTVALTLTLTLTLRPRLAACARRWRPCDVQRPASR